MDFIDYVLLGGLFTIMLPIIMIACRALDILLDSFLGSDDPWKN